MPFSSNVPPFTVNETITWDDDGLEGYWPVFTVTGDVLVRIVPVCKVSLASAAAAELMMGIEYKLDAMIATTTATDIDANEVWIDGTPDSFIELESDWFAVSNSNDIRLWQDDQIDSGSIAFYCEWKPLSDGSSVVAANTVFVEVVA